RFQRKQFAHGRHISAVGRLELSPLFRLNADATCVVVAAEFNLFGRELLWLCETQLALLLSRAAERGKFPIELIEIVLPILAIVIDGREESVGCRSPHLRRKILSLKLLKQNMNQVQVRVAQMQPSAFIAIKVE